MVERPPTTVRIVLDITAHETYVHLPQTTEGAVTKVRVIAWHYIPLAGEPFIQIQLDGGLQTEALTFGDALRADCIQLYLPVPGTILSSTERGVPVCHFRDLRTRFRVRVYDDATPPAPLTPQRLVLWLEVDLV